MIEPTKEDIGRKVIYRRGSFTGIMPIDTGVITSLSTNKRYAFVRYGSDNHSKATLVTDLDWLEQESS